MSINNKPVNSVADVQRISASLKPGDAVQFRVLRATGQGRNADWKPCSWRARCRPLKRIAVRSIQPAVGGQPLAAGFFKQDRYRTHCATDPTAATEPERATEPHRATEPQPRNRTPTAQSNPTAQPNPNRAIEPQPRNRTPARNRTPPRKPNPTTLPESHRANRTPLRNRTPRRYRSTAQTEPHCATEPPRPAHPNRTIGPPRTIELHHATEP